MGKGAQALMLVVPTALGGSGPFTQASEIDKLLLELTAGKDIPIRRVVAEMGQTHFHDARIIPSADSVADTYQNVGKAIKAELEDLVAGGVTHVGIVNCGYTSYALFGIHKALREINGDQLPKRLTASVVIQDSCLPEVGQSDADLMYSERWPDSRFYAPAYGSSDEVKVTFAMNGAVPFNGSSSPRRHALPRSMDVEMATYPFSSAYEAAWTEAGTPDHRQGARIALNDWLMKQGVRPSGSTRVVPILGSEIPWQEEKIPSYMTREQFDTVVQGTKNCVQSLRDVARRHGISIVLPLRHAMYGVLRDDLPTDVWLPRGNDRDLPIGVTLVPHGPLPRSKPAELTYMELITGSDLVIQRSVQTNSTGETLLAGVPQAVVTMPSSVMDNEAMEKALPVGLLPFWDPAGMTRFFDDVLFHPEARDAATSALTEMYASMKAGRSTNFAHLLETRVIENPFAGLSRTVSDAG